MATIQTCGRTASITGHYEDNYSYKTITIDSDNLDVSSPQVSYSMPEGTVYSATMNYTFKKNLAFSNDLWFPAGLHRRRTGRQSHGKGRRR